MNYVTCPKCNGFGRIPAGDNKWKFISSGYRESDDTFKCDNCGGQYMMGVPTGKVRFDKNNNPCYHSYKSQNVGRCLTQYSCEHCGDTYQIDSGD